MAKKSRTSEGNRKSWFSELKASKKSAAKRASELFPNARFVVLRQDDARGAIYRETALVRGPYVICITKSRVSKKCGAARAFLESPHAQLEKQFMKGAVKMYSVTDHCRKYRLTGEVVADVEERFYDVDTVNVSAYCGSIFDSDKDLRIAMEFVSGHEFDLCLFPEWYPLTKEGATAGKFPEGVVYGGRSAKGHITYFADGSGTEISKCTHFAKEKKLIERARCPKVITYGKLKVAVILCYDLMNPNVAGILAKSKPDIVLVPAMVAKNDIGKWTKFMYARGQELQAPIVLASNQDRRKLCAARILFYDPISERVTVLRRPATIRVEIGRKRLTESPQVHWTWLFRNGVYGPFAGDFGR
ncbi:Uncharacterised protein [uncultured archaeon]|nr:Uncharacterised protein [uncultured archaeon]